MVGEHLNVRLALRLKSPMAIASSGLREEAACKGIVAVVILFTAPLPPVAMTTGHSGPASSLHGNAQWWGC